MVSFLSRPSTPYSPSFAFRNPVLRGHWWLHESGKVKPSDAYYGSVPGVTRVCLSSRAFLLCPTPNPLPCHLGEGKASRRVPGWITMMFSAQMLICVFGFVLLLAGGSFLPHVHPLLKQKQTLKEISPWERKDLGASACSLPKIWENQKLRM